MLQVPLTMVDQVPPVAYGEGHSGAGMTCRLWKTMVEPRGRCEEEGAAVLTSTPHSPSQAGGRGFGSEGVRLSLGRGRRGRCGYFSFAFVSHALNLF